MSLRVNGQTPEEIRVDGVSVSEVRRNGVMVWPEARATINAGKQVRNFVTAYGYLDNTNVGFNPNYGSISNDDLVLNNKILMVEWNTSNLFNFRINGEHPEDALHKVRIQTETGLRTFTIGDHVSYSIDKVTQWSWDGETTQLFLENNSYDLVVFA